MTDEPLSGKAEAGPDRPVAGAGGALCPVCVEAADPDAERCPSCGTGLRLNGRYRFERLLGSGGQGRTYAAQDLATGTMVAVKELSIAHARDWKTVELFRREAAVLAGIDHPGVPKLVESFEIERRGVTFYYLAQELVDGENLADALRRGERFDEAKAIAIARDLLEILAHLHGRSPPVVHRDVKPSNVMRRRDGSLVLIDFDIVRQLSKPGGGSTLAVGTPGFAPLEQYVGEPVPATDLYALGATIVALLSRREPSTLMAPGEPRIDFREHVNVSDGFAGVLAHLLEPDVRKRYARAEDVLAELDAGRTPPARPPHGSRPARRGRPVRRILEWLLLGIVIVLTGGYLALAVHRCRTDDERSFERALESAREGEQVEFEPAGMTGTLQAFDPMANLAWALGIARRWAPDAGLESIRIEGVGPDGFMVLSGGSARLSYTFASRAKVETYWADLATFVKPIDYQFELSIAEGQTKIRCITGQPRRSVPTPVTTVSCGPREVFAGMKQIGWVLDCPNAFAFLEFPFEGDAYQEPLRWFAGCPQGAGAFVDARTCEVRTLAPKPPGSEPDTPPPRPAYWRPVTRTGRVTAVGGAAPAAIGAACELVVEPQEGGPRNCRVRVSCDGTPLYPRDGGGYVNCRFSETGPANALDRDPTSSDGDGMFEMDLEHDRVAVGDAPPDGFSVEIALDPPSEP